MKKIYLLISLVCFAITFSASAANLVIYSFTGDTVTPTSELTGITASSFAASDPTGGFNANYFGASGTPGYKINNIGDPTPVQFFSFTTDVTSASDSVLYESFDFYQNRFEAPTKYSVSYTISGNTEVFIASGVNASNQGTAGQPGNMTEVNLDFADFTTSESVEWRIYAYDSINATNAFRVDDVAVNGAVIPEASTYALFSAFIALGFIILRRSKS